MRKKILVIGMLDSIHLARWLEQFEQGEYDFYLFPSQKYRKINPKLRKLLLNKSKAKYIFHGFLCKGFYSGYLDYLRFEFLGLNKFKSFRRKMLANKLRSIQFDFIHAIEIQGAGYLLGSIEYKYWSEPRTILTNWGSDIFYFSKIYEHEVMIRNILSKVNYYSAECERDYDLALKLGFKGGFLPCVPNAGGFDLDDLQFNYTAPDKRKQIIIKGYGGLFGRSDIPISIIERLSQNFPEYCFFIYSVTSDSLELINKLPKEVLKKIRVSIVKKPLTQKEMLQEFSRSRLYIGCSESDGISTSFLESLFTGAYPIQTNTSCADEWIKKGVIGSLVNLDAREVWREASKALTDHELVNNAALVNLEVSKKFLAYSKIQTMTSNFYK
jgi:hypothetical protein